ncbi:TatD family hydrolase [Polynucleobacter sp. MWH-Braz-FAM2G]|uniref:TatD family hydrolase n=1 Tax=Polynucleobacter sp. MWH-Braz-FAM2G TaxID=1855883 RepID=UPI001BFD84FA|nr:TatD family hydrolase [Polynucleobacter sp. MWH-Braz-FAM2G]QWD91844.1 TatD family hydrolase [Polynucleobacter sp. MWH-Braz-FAM2G]
MWIDTHCHLDAPEFAGALPEIIREASNKNVKALLLPAVKASDCLSVKNLTQQHSSVIPGLVYTLGIHPLYTNQAQEGDIAILEKEVVSSLSDPRFVGVGEIGLDYFVEGLDPRKQEFFFNAQLDLAQQHQLPVILHVRRSQDVILKALRRRNIPGGIAHAFNGSFQQAEQFIELGFKLGFGGAATYERALQIRRLLKDLPLESIVTETDAPDIPPAWLRQEGIAFNEPAFLPRIVTELAAIRGISDASFAQAVWGNAMQALPRWSTLCADIPSFNLAS